MMKRCKKYFHADYNDNRLPAANPGKVMGKPELWS